MLYIGKVFFKILNNRLVQCLDKKGHYMRDRLALDLFLVSVFCLVVQRSLSTPVKVACPWLLP